ncbi:hypothetical protein Tco_1097315 [Tanacetum coccineum]
MILGCAGSLKANLQHMEALSITKAGYMTFTEAWKKKIWLKGLLAESGYELSLVASALVKGGSWSEVPAQVEGAAYRFDQEEVFVVWFFWKEQEGSILFGLPSSRQQKFLVLRFFDVKEQQGIDRINKGSENKSKTCRGCKLNIEKLDGNIVQKYGGSKQVGFKQLGPGIETGVHGVHDEKRVWFEVELHGAQGDCDVEVFQVSNDDTAVAQRRLEDKQPEEKTTQTAWNMGLNESEKTFIGSGVGTGSMQVLHGFEFKRATLSVETIQYREDSNEAAFTVATVEKIYAHESLTFNNTLACEVISKCKARLKDDMDARSDVYVLSNGCKKCSDNSDGYYWESTPAGYMTFIEAWKKEIWLKGHLTELGYELSLVAGIATGALVKGGSQSEVPAQVEGAAYRY